MLQGVLDVSFWFSDSHWNSFRTFGSTFVFRRFLTPSSPLLTIHRRLLTLKGTLRHFSYFRLFLSASRSRWFLTFSHFSRKLSSFVFRDVMKCCLGLMLFLVGAALAYNKEYASKNCELTVFQHFSVKTSLLIVFTEQKRFFSYFQCSKYGVISAISRISAVTVSVTGIYAWKRQVSCGDRTSYWYRTQVRTKTIP